MSSTQKPLLVLYRGVHVRLVRHPGYSYYGGSMQGTRYFSPRTELQTVHGSELHHSHIPHEVRKAIIVEGRLSAKKTAELVDLARSIDEQWDQYLVEHREKEAAEQKARDDQYRADEHARRVRNEAFVMRAMLEEVLERGLVQETESGALYHRIQHVLLKTAEEVPS